MSSSLSPTRCVELAAISSPSTGWSTGFTTSPTDPFASSPPTPWSNGRGKWPRPKPSGWRCWRGVHHLPQRLARDVGPRPDTISLADFLDPLLEAGAEREREVREVQERREREAEKRWGKSRP